MSKIACRARLWIAGAAVLVILLTVATLALKHKAGPNATAKFLGNEAEWSRCRITTGHWGLSGILELYFEGSGDCLIRTISGTGRDEERYRFTLTTEESFALRRLLIEQDLCSVTFKSRPLGADESGVRLSLFNARGQEAAINKPNSDRAPAFDRVYAALTDLRQKTKGIKPEYTGPRQRNWRPPAPWALPDTRPATAPATQPHFTATASDWHGASPGSVAISYADTCVFTITSPRGIGDTIITLTEGPWPRQIVVRLQYAPDAPFQQYLENFRAQLMPGHEYSAADIDVPCTKTGGKTAPYVVTVALPAKTDLTRLHLWWIDFNR